MLACPQRKHSYLRDDEREPRIGDSDRSTRDGVPRPRRRQFVDALNFQHHCASFREARRRHDGLSHPLTFRLASQLCAAHSNAQRFCLRKAALLRRWTASLAGALRSGRRVAASAPSPSPSNQVEVMRKVASARRGRTEARALDLSPQGTQPVYAAVGRPDVDAGTRKRLQSPSASGRVHTWCLRCSCGAHDCFRVLICVGHTGCEQEKGAAPLPSAQNRMHASS